MASPQPDRLAGLPRWAQSRIRVLEEEVAFLRGLL